MGKTQLFSVKPPESQTQTILDSANIPQRPSETALPPLNPVAHARFGPSFFSIASQPIIQAKMTVGPVGDTYEQEADTVARQVVQNIQRQEMDEDELQMSPAPKTLQRADGEDELQMQSEGIGASGGAVNSSLESTIQSAKGSGSPLSDSVRQPMEQAFGADFSKVRVHNDATSDSLNRSIQAKAFTTGSDVFFRSGAYQPTTTSGQELLAHELTHTIQQGATKSIQPRREIVGVQRSPEVGGGDSATAKVSRNTTSSGLIQRDIGFEFETRQMFTKKSNTGPLPAGGFANHGAATTVDIAPTTTRVKKGDALLAQPDIEVQADDSNGMSDVEVVTTHFPLNPGGRGRLVAAMTNFDALLPAYAPLNVAAGGYVTARALDGVGGFNATMPDGYFVGDMNVAQTAGQVTFGTRAGNIGDIVKDLHADAGENPVEKADRDPGRLRMRRANPLNNAEPTALAGGSEGETLVNGYALAQQAVNAYQLANVGAPGGNELVGLLTIIFTYCESMQHKQAFLKNHTPLMAKTNLATIFTTLPNNVKTHYSQRDNHGTSNLETLVGMAAGYPAKMNQPLFAGVAGLVEDDKPHGQNQWYHKLTLKSWLDGIVMRDRTVGEALVQFIHDNQGGSTLRPGKDKLTTKEFPKRPKGQEVEGYGALGKKMDAGLPVFELRSATKMITYAQAHQWALDFFDYISSLNANPGGGHTRMI